MRLRAERSVFWPNMSQDIEATRQRCLTCNRHAPSQAAMPPIPPVTPEYPFQHVAADYFTHLGHTYGVVVDRFSNWFQLWRGMSLREVLTELCRGLGVPETLTSDGGPQFMAQEVQDFLAQHGIHHRLASVAFPHANCRAEVAVKTAKRLIRDNVSADGSLDSLKLTRALLQHRNTPDRDTGLSPAELVLGRQLRDFLPGLPIPPPLRTHTDLSQTWQDVARWREKALSKRASRDHERLQAHTKDLPPLHVGQCVLVQNQSGNHPRHWDRRGVVVAVLPFRQYHIRLDGSRRLTLRNRKFLRAFTPITPSTQPACFPAPSPFIPPEPPTPRPSRVPVTDDVSQSATSPHVPVKSDAEQSASPSGVPVTSDVGLCATSPPPSSPGPADRGPGVDSPSPPSPTPPFCSPARPDPLTTPRSNRELPPSSRGRRRFARDVLDL